MQASSCLLAVQLHRLKYKKLNEQKLPIKSIIAPSAFIGVTFCSAFDFDRLAAFIGVFLNYSRTELFFVSL